MRSKLPVNIQDLLRQRKVEGDRIEYKAGWNPDAILRTICAFANDFENLGGGYTVIGQNCDQVGQPIFPPAGLEENQLDKIQRELLQFCSLIQPPYFPIFSIECVAGKNLVILWSPGGQNRPYRVPRLVTSKKKDYCHYIRRYSNTVEAKDEDERELISLTARVPFDDRFNHSAEIDQLSSRLMEVFLRDADSELANQATAISVETLGRQLNVIGGPSEAAMPKNIGLLFFNEHPREFFPATQIDVVWFPEGVGGDRFDEKIFEGPLARITSEALNYIQTNYLKQTVIKYPDRAESDRFWNFPYAAIEEALVNAVYHRSYEIREPIEVRVTPGELTVLSFPGPDRAIQMKDLRSGRAVNRRYRNRRIGEFLKELGLTEGRATGIKKILTVMQKNGSPLPEIESDETRSYFLIRLPAHPNALSGKDKSVSFPAKTSEKRSEKTSEKIMIEIRKNPDLSIARLSEVIGITTRSVERNLKKLQEAGRLERSGSPKGGHWVIKE